MVYNTMKEMAFIVAETYRDICQVADEADMDREEALDIFLYMFNEVRGEINSGTFDATNVSHFS